jgi:hypothetical protein
MTPCVKRKLPVIEVNGNRNRRLARADSHDPIKNTVDRIAFLVNNAFALEEIRAL